MATFKERILKKSVSHQDALRTLLKDPKDAAAYLNAALEEGDSRMFLIALKNVADAHGGMARLSREAKLNRANLYRMLSKQGRPEIQSLHKVLEAFGLKLSVSVDRRAA